VLETGETYISSELKSDPLVSEKLRAALQHGESGVCVPIRMGDDFSGVLFVIVEAPRELTSAEVHLLGTLAEMGGSAIHRMRLHQQTGEKLQRLGALGAIDIAISSSVDLRIVLNILIEQVVTQLKVDAACVLLL